MSPATLRLIGNVSDICRPVYSSDNQEQVTVSVEGAEPLLTPRSAFPTSRGGDLAKK